MKVSLIKYSDINSSMRLNGKYHLSKGNIYSKKLRSMPFEELGNLTSKIFTAGRSKRVYTDKDHGYPYLSNTDVVKSSSFETCNYNSKKYGYDESSFLKEGMIVTGRVGAIGQTSYITSEFEEFKAMGSDNIIRIVPNDINISGYIYSFLASKYGNTLLWKLAAGGVQSYISEEMLLDMPIPMLEKPKQQTIHNLIVEASYLRVEANKLLRSAQEIIMHNLAYKKEEKPLKIALSTLLNSHQKRFESQYFISEGYQIKEHIKGKKYQLLKDVSEPIFRPGIFKRHYVEKGVEFFGGSDIVKAIPKSEKRLSIAKTKHLESLKIKEDWILVTCGGTIGFSVLVNRFMANKTASQHILRVSAKNIKTGYLFAFMSSEIGLKAIQSFTYGSVIPQIEPHHLDLLPIPILEDSIMDKIHYMIMEYKEKISIAIENELLAIDLIEKEIESWQK